MSRTSPSRAATETKPPDESLNVDSRSPLAETLDAAETIQINQGQRRLWKWIEHLLLVVLVVGFAVKGFVPAWRHLNSDFPNYYLVARLYRAGYPLERVYDWTWLQRQKDRQGIDQRLVSFIPSTLPSALAVAPWSSLPPLQAKRRWLVLNLAVLLLTAFLLTRVTQLGWERIALLTFLAFIPLRNEFLYGQMHLVVLLLLTLAAWLFFRDSQFLSGISLAMAAALKIFPALFVIYFAWKRQWRAAFGLAVGLIGAMAASLYLFGKSACLLYVRQVLPAGLRGETLDPYNPAWNSWTALVWRLFIAEPELNPSPVAHLPWLYAFLQPFIHAVIFVVFMWAIGSKKRNDERTKIEWATFLFLLLFLSSQPGSYHFVALILTAALIVDYLLAHERFVHAGIAVALYALIGAPMLRLPWPSISATGWQNLLFFPRLAWMTAFAAVLLWMLIPRSTRSLSACFHAKPAVIAASTLIVITAAGFISNQRHLRGQFENYNSRIAVTPGGLLASDPALTSTGILFTSMTPTGYTIRREQNGERENLPGLDGDWFHPTAAGDSNSIWAEQSTLKGSRIVRFTLGATGSQSPLTTNAVEAENAGQPAVSRDGQLLAFLRPVQGRNSLWVQKITPTSSTPEGSGSAQPTEIAGEEYDVREATFLPDHRLIFSAKRNDRLRLFVASQSDKVEIEELNEPACSARYPAISPDGRWIAFSCEEGSATQIHVADLNGTRGLGKKDMQLTSADCNSISPAWTSDSKKLVYATDCGRGLGLTALVQATVFP
jgi:hypothetical protein